MKKLIYIFIIILSACVNKTSEKIINQGKGKSEDEIINQGKEKSEYEIIKNELASGVRNDTIFMDFVFGMSKQEANSHFKELVEKEKLYVNENNNKYAYDDFEKEKLYVNENNNKYAYDFVFDLAKGEANFSLKYHNNSLYKFKLFVEPKEIDFRLVFSTEENYIGVITTSLQGMYHDKYGPPDINKERIATFIDTKMMVWIQGNRKIEIFEGTENAIVKYIDLSKKVLIEKEIDKEKEQKKLENFEDI